MKKIFLFSLVIIIIVIAGCENKKVEEQKIVSKPKLVIKETPKAMDLFDSIPGQQIPVGSENFKKLANYIEKHGFVVTNRGIPCNRQITFFDKTGARHAMITIKVNKHGKPAMDGTVGQISVWANYDGINHSANFFSYEINEKIAYPSIIACRSLGHTEAQVKKIMTAIKTGYDEFLAKINKET